MAVIRTRAWPRIWKVHLDRPDDPDWSLMLSAAERERARRLGCPLERQRYLAAHAALRAILGPECGVCAGDLEFGADPGGRPHVVWPDGVRRLDFNLSHAGEWALVAVTQPAYRVGVDIEQIRPDLDYRAMAGHLYQPTEVAHLDESDPDDRRAEYFRLWSAKEAYVKATGVGLAGFRDVLVEPDTLGGPHGLVQSRSHPGTAWPVRWLDIAPGYTAAVVILRLLHLARLDTPTLRGA